MRLLHFIYFSSLLLSCSEGEKKASGKETSASEPFIVVLGNAQDAGYPQASCNKECCAAYYSGKEMKHFVSCIALCDPKTKQRWLFDCTPDFPAQLHLLDSIFPSGDKSLSGIFLTHAHIGHYTGLIYLGRESMNTSNIPVYCMDGMNEFLQSNKPWIQLVTLANIDLVPLHQDSAVKLGETISITPFCVPHRDEFSETLGYKISVGKKSAIFIPDIDKWEKWDTDILELLPHHDLFLIDGTFFKAGEIPGRNMSEIPHPFIEESMKLFDNVSAADKAKIHFIHLNHTNPALIESSAAQQEIESKGFRIAKQKDIYQL